jgi:hypothetical protein
VGASKPATPKDAADSGDKTLTAAAPPAPPKPAAQVKRAATKTVTVTVGMVNVQQTAAPKLPATTALEQRFSLGGNNNLW